MAILPALERAFDTSWPTGRSDLLLVAFSGGPDSTALLWGLGQLGARRGLRVVAVHLDHGLDPDSGRRAAAAERVAEALALPFEARRIEVPRERRPRESPEAAARRVRYRFLEEERRRWGARYVATAHHADDQIETVLLRLLYGSGLEGLAGIAPRRGAVVRPLLDLRRRELAAAVVAAGLTPVEDPTNRDLGVPRNRLRERLLPRLRREHPGLDESLLRLAATARSARRRVRGRLRRRLSLAEPGRVAREALAALPDPLWPSALALLHREAGAPHPPHGAARRELRRQCRAGGRVGCDCGGGWHWEGRQGMLRLARRKPPTPDFAYTLQVPGECEIPELAVRFRLRRGVVAGWMFAGSPERTGLALPLADGARVVVRNRRPGDRIRPLGCLYSRRLKDVLIDRRVPRMERARLPLLVVGDRLAWVPGVTVAEEFGVRPGGEAWIAEIVAG